MVIRVFFFGLALSLASCQRTGGNAFQGQNTISLEQVVPLRPEFFPNRFAVQWVSESEYVFKEMNGMKKYNADTYSLVSLISDFEMHNLSNYTVGSFCEGTDYALLISNRKKVYRYSDVAEYSVYNLKDKSIRKISNGDELQVVKCGFGKSLAYVRDNNVYYVRDIDRPSEAVALTNEGIPGEVYFGTTDWIYEEEQFNSAQAMWFSPTGSYLAVASFNDTQVESAIYPVYGNPDDQYPYMEHFKYPKAGRQNPVVGLQVFKLNDLTSEPWVIPAPVDVVGLDHILGRVEWASDNNIVVLWMNRRQNIGILANCDLKTDKCNMETEQNEPNGWIDVRETFFDDTGNKMMEIQPLNFGDQRFLHVARFDFQTMTSEDLTPGNDTVQELLGWNDELDTAYYLLTPKMFPWLKQLWATTGGEMRCISCKEAYCHSVTADFAPKAKYGIVSCSSTNNPPRFYLFDSKDDSLKLLVDNQRLADTLSQYKLPMVLFNTIKIKDTSANIKLLIPPMIEKGKTYPMVVRVYAGPRTTRVHDSFDIEYYNTYLSSNRSFIVASIDVRGSGVMGVEALYAVNNALGTVEITDTLEAISRLVKIYPFIDASRIGVWGWSYGGFASTMMLMKDNQRTLACAAAVAPVTSWLYYDSIYTERYMGTPDENPYGYANSDLVIQAELLRDKRFLLIHGSGDDNVHYQNSLQLSKQLQKADISFEQMSYADENHSLLGVSLHLYHTLDRFWTNCFNV